MLVAIGGVLVIAWRFVSRKKRDQATKPPP